MKAQSNTLFTKAQEVLGMHNLRLIGGTTKNVVPVYTSRGTVNFQLFCGVPAAEEIIEMPPLTVFSSTVQEAYQIVRKAGYETRIAVFRNEHGRNDYHLEVVLWSDDREGQEAILYLKLLDHHFDRGQVEKLLKGVTVRLTVDEALAICGALNAGNDGEAEGCLDSPDNSARKGYEAIMTALRAVGQDLRPNWIGGAS